MKKKVMPFEEFAYIMTRIKEYEEKKERISNFLQDELCTDSHCLFNVGEDISHILTCLLADEFNCWFERDYNPAIDELKKEMGIETESKAESSFPKWWDKSVRAWDNDIEYWLYEDSKVIGIDGTDVPIGTLQEFYDYLVKHCIDKN